MIVRGQSSGTGIGMVAELAKTMTTTLVLWDRHHKPKDEAKAGQHSRVLGSLAKSLGGDSEEEGLHRSLCRAGARQGGDATGRRVLLCGRAKVRSRAARQAKRWKKGGAAPRHLAEEKLMTEAQLERPLFKALSLR